jgi:hypothetical protein
MGGKTNTSTSQQTSTPVNQAALQNIYNTVAGAASTPYTPYSGELNAGINAQQTAGINTINGASNFASPYIQSAGALAQGAANPLTSAQIQQYQNPYIQNVVDATQAQFNDQNGQAQNALKGNAASQGALGGDRQAVAQTTLAKNQQIAQAPTIANLYSNSYNSGLQTAAQQYQQNPLAAASSLAGIGTAGQTAALQGGQAQIAAGTLQQQTQQGADTAAYQQYLQAQGIPYAQAAFLQQYGLPTALAQGTTSSGTQTSPGPNPFTQALGLGTAALTAFSDERVKENKEEIGKTYDGQPIYRFNYIGSPMTQIGLMAQNVEHSHPDAVGESGGIKTVDYGKATEDAAGRGKFASGGAALPFGGVSFIPGGGASNAQLHAPSLSFAKPQDSGGGMDASLGKFIGTAGKSGLFSDPAYGGGNALTGEYGGSSSNPLPGLDASDYGPGYSSGGFVDAIHQIHRAVKRASGGAVGNTPFQSYADGGWAMDDRFGAAFPQRDVPPPPILAKDDDVVNPGDPIRMPDQPAVDAWRQGVDKTSPAPEVNPAAVPAASPMRAPLPKQITNPDDTPTEPTTALAYSGASPMTARPTEPAAPESRWGGFNPFGLSDKAREAIITGALGVAASRSPFALSAIGEGGLSGMKQYSASTQAEQEAADKAATRGQEQQRIDLQAKQIASNIENQKRELASSPLIPDGKGGMMVNPAYVDSKKALKDLDIPTGYRETKNGYEAIPGGPADPNVLARVTKAKGEPPNGYRLSASGGLEPIPGGPTDPAIVKAQAEAKRVAASVLDDDTIHDMADQYLAGDRTVMQNLGRGAQGSENIVKLRQAIAKQAREAGLDPKGIVNAFNEQAGAIAGQRAVGVRAANISLAANEANNMIPIALAASDKVARGDWMPWNELVQRVQKGRSSPELASFVAATNSLVNAYVRAVSPSGVPTDSMRQHAYDMLNSAQGPDAYKAVVSTMQQEMKAALSAPGAVKDELRKGNDATAAAGHSAPAPAASKPATVIQNGHTYTLQPDGSYK